MLAKGDFFANSSSPHHLGRQSASQILSVTDSLKDFFQLSKFDVFYHSGTTEAFNTFILNYVLQQRPFLFVYSPLDHQCVLANRQRVERMGGSCLALLHDENGDLQLEQSLKLIEEQKRKTNLPVFVNYTWVNNETGVCWPLENALKIKKAVSAIIHVDATQSIGKIAKDRELLAELDLYSYSAHKFGGMKGVGWSFVKDLGLWQPIMLGGSQQKLRSSTMNNLSIISIAMALDELKENKNDQLAQQLNQFKQELAQVIGQAGQVLCLHSQNTNCNTLSFFLKKYPAQMLIPLFEAQQLVVSSGSACSSGTSQGSHVMNALGHGQWARNLIRISLDPTIKSEQCQNLQKATVALIQKLI